MEDLQKHFGPWPNEKCWNIKSDKLAKIICTQNEYSVSIESNMSYNNYTIITKSHRTEDIHVNGSTYSYLNGDCTFIAENMDSVKKWVDNYNKIITL